MCIKGRLRAAAIVEIGSARPFASDCIHKFPGLVVTKRNERIAFMWIAGTSRPAPVCFRNLDRLQTWSVGFPGLKFIPLASNEHETALAPIDLDIIEAAPALVTA